ncbi:family 16 glycosylhydrolase [Rhodopseudomonas telluris]|uniref:Family 16 glycosylhydrolase n=1 Tax=Rhodopseudomonas telluris TaxID=644215 RepID=A0ABV6EWN9_9BRAD
MALSTPTGYSADNLVYQEDFDGNTLNTAWHKYITSKAANGSPWNSYNGGSGPGGQFEAEFDMPGQVSVHDGVLDITSSKTPITGMNQGTVMNYPMTSGVVSSYGNFEFTGGLLQVSMKQPAGNGAWPGIWLMPGSGSSAGDNFEIDIQEGGYTGKGPANQAFQWHLHTPNGDVGGVVDTGVDLTADFHTYAIDWQPGKSITWYLDGKQMAQVTSAQLPIPTQPMELILDSQWANSKAAGWHTTVDSSTPSTTHMLVDGVQLYQKAGSGQTVKGGNVTAGTTPVTPNSPVTPVNVAPTVSGATALPGTGVEHVGDKIALTLAFDEAVTVSGKPTLSLNDGSVATYVSGSGTDKLVFSTTVAATDRSTSALAITGVNLTNGASIKDAGGLAANLAGAVKTFAGLSVDTSPVTSPVVQPPQTSGPTKPTLVVADNTLSVNPGGKINLGIDVSTADKNDIVSVNIKGLPRYETITDGLGHVHRGSNITLSAAEVESGLTLQSNYRGTGSPTATLSVTATGKDPVTGTSAASAVQTITVVDPPVSAGGIQNQDQGFALLSQALAGGFHNKADLGAIASATSSNVGHWLNQSVLTRPHG